MDTIAALVFASADKTAANPWLLGVKDVDDEQGAVQMYEDDPHTYHLSLDTSLGSHLTSLLAENVFEEA